MPPRVRLGCHLEINAQPERLDLNDLHAQAAKQAGVKLAVSTDAHSANSFDYIRFGIDQARRGWLTADDVINTKPLAELRKLLKRKSVTAEKQMGLMSRKVALVTGSGAGIGSCRRSKIR